MYSLETRAQSARQFTRAATAVCACHSNVCQTTVGHAPLPRSSSARACARVSP